MDILAENMCYGLCDKGQFIMVVGLFIIVVGFFTIISDSFISGLCDSVIPGVVIIIVGMIVAIISVGAICIHKEPYKKLKVILSDDYPANELYENYTIVDQDGKIWILNEKH